MYSVYITLYQICKYEAREALSKFQAKKDVNKKKPVNSSGGGIGSGNRAMGGTSGWASVGKSSGGSRSSTATSKNSKKSTGFAALADSDSD